MFEGFKYNMKIVLRTWSGKIGIALLIIQVILALYAVVVYYPEGMRQYEQGKQVYYTYRYPSGVPPCWVVDNKFNLINITKDDLAIKTEIINSIPEDLKIVAPDVYGFMKKSYDPILKTGVIKVVYKEYEATFTVENSGLPSDMRMLLMIKIPAELQENRKVFVSSGWMFLERPDNLSAIIFYQGQLYTPGANISARALTIYGSVENVSLDGSYVLRLRPEGLKNYYNNKFIGPTMEQTITMLYSYYGMDVNESSRLELDPRIIVGTYKNGKLKGLPGTYKLKIGLYALVMADSATAANESLDVVAFSLVLMPNCYGYFGTDTYSRPIGLGLLLGLPYAFLLGFTVTFASTFIGAIYGTLAGYWKDLRGEALMRIADIVLSLPFLPILIAISFAFGTITLKSLAAIMIALSWAGPVIVVRSMSLQISEQLYIEAAKAVGVPTRKIIFKHIFPQIYPYTMALAVLSIPGIIVAEASLSLLGFGDPAAPTWGKMLQLAYNVKAVSTGQWWLYIFPGLALVIFSATFLLVGRAIEPIVAPKLQK